MKDRLVFISYRRADTGDLANELFGILSGEIGESCVFRDLDRIQPGQNFEDKLEVALKNTSVLLAIIGCKWFGARNRWLGIGSITNRIDDENDYVRQEIRFALRKGILAIPVVVGDAKMPPSELLPADIRALAKRHALFVNGVRDFRGLEGVVKSVKGALSPPPPPPTHEEDPFTRNADHVLNYLERARHAIEHHLLEKGADNRLYQCGLLNLISLGCQIIPNVLVKDITANLMEYDGDLESLNVVLTNGFHPYESVTRPWKINLQEYPNPQDEPGICVQAFRTGEIRAIPSMHGHEKRRDEEIQSMISIPLSPHRPESNRLLAVLNLNIYDAGNISEHLTQGTKSRIKRVQTCGSILNNITSIRRANEQQNVKPRENSQACERRT